MKILNQERLYNFISQNNITLILMSASLIIGALGLWVYGGTFDYELALLMLIFYIALPVLIIGLFLRFFKHNTLIQRISKILLQAFFVFIVLIIFVPASWSLNKIRVKQAKTFCETVEKRLDNAFAKGHAPPKKQSQLTVLLKGIEHPIIPVNYKYSKGKLHCNFYDPGALIFGEYRYQGKGVWLLDK